MSEGSQPQVQPQIQVRPRSIAMLQDKVMPWLISLLFHAGVFLIMCFFVQVVVMKDRDAVAGPVDTGFIPTGQADFQGLENSGFYGTDKNVIRLGNPDAVSPLPKGDPLAADIPAVPNGTGGEESTVPIPGTQDPKGRPNGSRFGNNMEGLTDGRPDGVPRKLGNAGPGRGLGGGNGVRVVYMLDASGSMLERLDGVRQRLLVDLGRLGYEDGSGRGDYFGIIFFQETAHVYSTTLQPATLANKRAAVKWAGDIMAHGSTNVNAAFKEAFKLKPTLIVMLTDGEFDEQATQTAVANLQKSLDHPARIVTVGFAKGSNVENLQKLAQENGGWKLLLEED